MKKILLFICCVLLLYGCSSDDEYEKIDLIIKKSELKEDGFWNIGYYSKNEFEFGISLTSVRYSATENRYVASNTVCPVHEDHKVGISTGSDRAAFCCAPVFQKGRAFFDAFDGRPINDEAGKHRLKVYNVSYNEETEEYRVWE